MTLLQPPLYVFTVQHKSPTVSDSPKLRTAERTRREKLGFLYEKPSFHPKINHEVPDFSRLHKAMQTAALRKTRSKDVTKCQPFCLRTSDFPARKSRMSPENSQVKCHLLWLWKFAKMFALFFLVSFQSLLNGLVLVASQKMRILLFYDVICMHQNCRR